ncbi:MULTISPECIES: LysR family transcriptional regulator [unclassified Chelatococcus]|uniref:LysR family transcriptional regulator n=1 Tax=unclassified Chelatococcus TaxID=2638111 RepID=UPI001BCDFD3D|nr:MULTISPECIES: LysR family transcriptional regulator [unclassified Chelatococcus]MBS7700265.1 LysR family transcriptional regulator [Chelatococcus sp. YT9]MBX3558236.1 LysR family transcriptional regulator [Chelatococcus sp.]
MVTPFLPECLKGDQHGVSLDRCPLWCMRLWMRVVASSADGRRLAKSAIMNSRQLEVFRAIMHYGTLTRAAQELNVSQSALSQVLLRMEDQIGLLFLREKGRLIPTALAELLYPEVDRVFGEIQNLRNLTEEIRLGRMAPVRVSSSAPLLMSFLPPLKHAIRESGLGVELVADVHGVGVIFDKVAAGAAEIGLTMIPSSSPKLRTEVVGETEMVCLLPTDHRLTGRDTVDITDLRGEALISYRRDNDFGVILAKVYAESGSTFRPDIEIDVSMTSVIFVQQALGVAVVEGASPWSAFSGVTVRPFRPKVYLPICIITSAFRLPTRSQVLIENNLRQISQARYNF